MIPILVTVVALSVPLPQIEGRSSPIDGDWDVVSLQTGDITVPAGVLGPSIRLQFEKGSGTMTAGEDAIKIRFKINTMPTPAEIDITPSNGPEKDRTSLGIFERKGDELTLCVRKPGNVRPTKFTSEAKPQTIIFRLKKREK